MTCPSRKSNVRITPDEWHAKLFQDLKSAQELTDETRIYREKVERQLESFRIDELVNEAEKTNVTVAHRINDIASWIKKLKKVYNHVELEIELLSAAKKAAETSLQNKNIPHDVNKFCLILRDRRATFEAVEDSVESELLREAKLIESSKISLNKMCNESFDLICKLQTVRNDLQTDLREKRSSITIGCSQLYSKSKIPEIAIPHIIKGDEDTTALKSKDRITYAESVMNIAQTVRDDIYKVIVQTEDAILNHKQKTDYEYHKRMHEIDIALEELQWQKKNIEDEKESLHDLLLNLEDSFQAKINKLKLVETRLETAPQSKCSNLHKTLTEERTRLKTLAKSLQKSMANTKGKFNALQSTLQVIETNLRDKLITQQLDQACMEERKKVTFNSMKRNKINHPRIP